MRQRERGRETEIIRADTERGREIERERERERDRERERERECTRGSRSHRLVWERLMIPQTRQSFLQQPPLHQSSVFHRFPN